MCWIERKIMFQIFPNCIFSSYGHFWTENDQLWWTFTITRIKKLEKYEIWFFIRFSTLRIFHVKMVTSEGEGGKGVCISLVGKHSYLIPQSIYFTLTKNVSKPYYVCLLMSRHMINIRKLYNSIFIKCLPWNLLNKFSPIKMSHIEISHMLIFVWLRKIHPTPGIESGGQMRSAISSISSVSATLDTRPRWYVSQFNRPILPGVMLQLSFSCTSLKSLQLNDWRRCLVLLFCLGWGFN